MKGERAFALLADASMRSMVARLPGAYLYSTGSYPIAVLASHQNNVTRQASVLGEIHWLRPNRYEALLTRLDHYEGDEYRRLLRPVILADDQAIEAWVYLGDADYAAQYPQIEHGDWQK